MSASNNIWRCSICHEPFGSQQDALWHIDRSNNTRRFYVVPCNAGVQNCTAAGVRVHIRTCAECKKSFPKGSGIKTNSDAGIYTVCGRPRPGDIATVIHPGANFQVQQAPVAPALSSPTYPVLPPNLFAAPQLPALRPAPAPLEGGSNLNHNNSTTNPFGLQKEYYSPEVRPPPRFLSLTGDVPASTEQKTWVVMTHSYNATSADLNLSTVDSVHFSEQAAYDAMETLIRVNPPINSIMALQLNDFRPWASANEFLAAVRPKPILDIHWGRGCVGYKYLGGSGKIEYVWVEEHGGAEELGEIQHTGNSRTKRLLRRASDPEADVAENWTL